MALKAKKKVEDQLPEDEEQEVTQDESEEFFAGGDDPYELDADLDSLPDDEDEGEEEVSEEETAKDEDVGEEEAVEEVGGEAEKSATKPEPAPVPEPAPTQQVTEPQPAPAPQMTPEQLQERYDAWRKNAMAQLVQHYQLPPETVEAFEEDPAKVLPQLLSQVYLDASTAVTQQVMAHLPQVIQQYTQVQQTAKSLEDKFFDTWKGLDRSNPQHIAAIQQIGTAYRQAIPHAASDDFINHVGGAAMVALGIQQAPATVEEAPGDKPKEAFKPAGASAPAPPPKRTKQSDNPITEFDMAFEADDLDLG